MENQSFESFYRSTRDDCFRALIVAVGSPYEADELLAEAYTRAWERWSNVREHPTPKAWVLSVATNLRRDRWRKAKRSLRVWTRPETDAPSPPIDPTLTAALAELSDQQRLAVAYRVFLDLDTAATARSMGDQISQFSSAFWSGWR
jgi:DNA-directed RNA polymerase specialized sigma24 family protein